MDSANACLPLGIPTTTTKPLSSTYKKRVRVTMASSSACLALGIPTTKPLISTYEGSFLRFSATFPTRTRFSNGAVSVSCCKNIEPVVYLNHDKQQLMVNDHPILKGMAENFTLNSVTEDHGHFLEMMKLARIRAEVDMAVLRPRRDVQLLNILTRLNFLFRI